MNTEPSRVAIIVLNWNGRHDTAACLQSIASTQFRDDLHVILVDNCSTECDPSVFCDSYPGLTIIRNEKNLGYAGGNNVGIRLARDLQYPYILLLNNDVLVQSDFIAPLIDHLRCTPEAAIVGPLVRNADGTVQFAGADLSRFTLRTRLRPLVPASRPVGVAYMMGCAILFPATLIDEIGLLDDGFFLYEEEKDFCLRARASGYHTFLIPTASIVHNESSSAGRVGNLKAYHLSRSLSRLLRKHRAGWSRLLGVSWLIISYLGPLVIMALVRGNPQLAKAWLRGFIAGGSVK